MYYKVDRRQPLHSMEPPSTVSVAVATDVPFADVVAVIVHDAIVGIAIESQRWIAVDCWNCYWLPEPYGLAVVYSLVVVGSPA